MGPSPIPGEGGSLEELLGSVLLGDVLLLKLGLSELLDKELGSGNELSIGEGRVEDERLVLKEEKEGRRRERESVKKEGRRETATATASKRAKPAMRQDRADSPTAFRASCWRGTFRWQRSWKAWLGGIGGRGGWPR